MKTHILIVTSEFPPQPGGIGNHAYNLAFQLSQSNFKVSVITDQRSLDGEEECEFDKNIGFEVHRIKLKRFRGLMYLERFYRLMALVDKVDVVMASGKFSLWNVAVSSIFRSKQFIAVIHGTEVNFKNPFIRKSIESSLLRFNHIIAVSNYTKSMVQHLRVPMTVIPNGYDSKKWKAGIIANNHLKGNPKLITIGNVTTRKGQLNVISLLPILKTQYPNIHYHCIGLPTEANTFSEKAKDLRVEDHLTFHGRLEDLEMQSLLMASDIFVMLSSETTSGDVEGFGIAVIEANALGLPAIGASGSGLEDAISDGVTGFLMSSNDSQAFMAGMKKILKDQKTFSQASKVWAAQHQWELVIKSYINIINNK